MNHQKVIRHLADKIARKTNAKRPKYTLSLYITGTTPQSTRAILNLKRICDQYLKGHYILKIIDIYQQPHLAKDAQIIAAPTLVKKLPIPLRRFIGDMSNEEHLLIGLDLQPRDENGSRAKKGGLKNE
ncbi:MAG TPA: circadian clock KaiB family protein [Nitrospiria bacterium]|jgi:circadian clock protein KaiB|nr:circadian clock KaiB family protein [Nitrospiria bacterium]